MTRARANRGPLPPPVGQKLLPGAVRQPHSVQRTKSRRSARRCDPQSLTRAGATAAAQLRRMIGPGAKRVGSALFRATQAVGVLAQAVRSAAGKIAGHLLERAGVIAEMTDILQSMDRATFDDGERREATAVMAEFLDLPPSPTNAPGVPVAIAIDPVLEEMPAIPAMGRLLLESELVVQQPLPTADQRTTAGRTMRALTVAVGRMVRVKSQFLERAHVVMRELFARHLRHYVRDQALMTDYFKETPPQGANCQANTKLVVAVLSDLGLTEADGWTLGVQVFRDHIQPVFYDAEGGVVWDLMGNTMIPEVVAPIYRPEILLHAFLHKQGGGGPLAADALQLAAANVPPSARARANAPTPPSNSNLAFASGIGSGIFRDGPIDPQSTLESPYTGDAQAVTERLQNQQRLSRWLKQYRKTPHDPDICYAVAVIYNKLGQHAHALIFARQVEQLLPAHHNSKVIIVESHRHLQQYTQAVEWAGRYANTSDDPAAAKVYEYAKVMALAQMALASASSVEQLLSAQKALTEFLNTWPADVARYATNAGDDGWWIGGGHKEGVAARLSEVQARLASTPQPE